jgi:hypothetical protein
MSNIGAESYRSGGTEPPLLAGQVAIQALYRELMTPQHPEINEFEWNITDANPKAIRDRLANTSMKDMLVAPGDKLAPDPEYSDFEGIYPGINAELTDISIGGYGTMKRKVRRYDRSRKDEFIPNPDIIVTEMDSVIDVEWPDKYEWFGNVSMRFWYDTAPHPDDQDVPTVGEVVLLETSHGYPGISPNFRGRIAVPIIDSNLHHQSTRQGQERFATEAEITSFISIIRDITP